MGKTKLLKIIGIEVLGYVSGRRHKVKDFSLAGPLDPANLKRQHSAE
jgi:hypothetical protein